MSKEEIKQLTKVSMQKTIKENLHSEMIFVYVDNLEQENKQLKGILQEIYERAINTNITSLDFRDYVLEILGDKENEQD